MVRKLTKSAKVQAEQSRISRLTNKHDEHFKIILSHQIENGYGFQSLHQNGRQIPSEDILKILRTLGKFIDDSTRLTITEVENRYKRPSDVSDGTFDPETQTKVQVEHFCLYQNSAQPDGASDSVRLHGYFRTNGGYFVVTRLDWFHQYHSN